MNVFIVSVPCSIEGRLLYEAVKSSEKKGYLLYLVVRDRYETPIRYLFMWRKVYHIDSSDVDMADRVLDDIRNDVDFYKRVVTAN